MEKKIIYLDPFSILVVNKFGRLVRVFCPFLARSLLDPNDKIEIIEMVIAESDLEFNFMINGKKFPSRDWDLII